SQFGLAGLDQVLLLTPEVDGLMGSYDGVNQKLKLFGNGAFSLALPYLRGSANTNIATDITAIGAAPANYNWISTTAVATNTTAFTIAKQPDVARNVCIVIHATNNGVTSTARTYTVNGKYNGVTQTEDIAIPGGVALTNGNILVSYGSKPFDSIDALGIVPSGAQPANTAHMAGLGSKIALPIALANGVETDIKVLTKAGANLTITGTADLTNNTVNMGALADNDHAIIKYLAKGIIGAELQAGTTLASTFRVMAVGI
ncbi:MAG: hypothetical protein ABFD94_15100, partial [Armatimonadia bacterium]